MEVNKVVMNHLTDDECPEVCTTAMKYSQFFTQEFDHFLRMYGLAAGITSSTSSANVDIAP